MILLYHTEGIKMKKKKLHLKKKYKTALKIIIGYLIFAALFWLLLEIQGQPQDKPVASIKIQLKK